MWNFRSQFFLRELFWTKAYAESFFMLYSLFSFLLSCFANTQKIWKVCFTNTNTKHKNTLEKMLKITKTFLFFFFFSLIAFYNCKITRGCRCCWNCAAWQILCWSNWSWDHPTQLHPHRHGLPVIEVEARSKSLVSMSAAWFTYYETREKSLARAENNVTISC